MKICVRVVVMGLIAAFVVLIASRHALAAPPSPVKILPPDWGGWFGGDLALEGNTLVIGAQWRPKLHAPGRGSAVVYRRTAGQWTLAADLFASDGQGAANFGTAVALGDSTVLVGDPDHSSPGPAGRSVGAVYVFQESDVGWLETSKLMAPTPQTDGRFGGWMTMSGQTAIIPSGGLIDFYDLAGGGLVRTDSVTPSLQDAYYGNGGLGGGLALEGDTALVGATAMDLVAPRPGGNVSLVNSGVVYALERDASGWHETQVLRPSDPKARGAFGEAISMSGDTAIIGRPGGAPDLDGAYSGAAYVFERVGGQWVESAKLQPSDGFTHDFFGAEVALSGNLAAVLAPAGATPRIYLFSKIADVWQEVGRIAGATKFSTDQFGISMDLEGGNLIIGARLDDQLGMWAGAAYSFVVPEPGAAWLACTGLLATFGVFRRAAIRTAW